MIKFIFIFTIRYLNYKKEMEICEKCKEEVKYYYCLKLCCMDCEDDYCCPHSCYLKREDEE